MQVSLRQMQVLSGSFQIAITEQHLDGAQVGAVLQQVCCPTMTKRVWIHALADASLARGLATSDPHGFVRDRLIEASAAGARGEQIEFRFSPAPILAQDLQQGWT